MASVAQSLSKGFLFWGAWHGALTFGWRKWVVCGEWYCPCALVFLGYLPPLFKDWAHPRSQVKGVPVVSLFLLHLFSLLFNRFYLFCSLSPSPPFFGEGGQGLKCLRLASNSLCSQGDFSVFLSHSPVLGLRDQHNHLAYGMLGSNPGLRPC